MTGLEPMIIEATVKALAGIIAKAAWDNSTSTYGQMSNKALQIYYDATKKYMEIYYKRHGQIKVLGMSKPLGLESIYTSIQSIENRNIWQYQSIEEREKAYWKSGERRLSMNDKKKEDGLEVANRHQYLMLLGEPGAGKSTFMRWIGLELIKGKKSGNKYPSMPILIELKFLDPNKIDLLSLIAEELSICGFPDSDTLSKKMLSNGQFLILFDGLDEVPSGCLSESIRKIQNFVDNYRQNHFVISCRTAAYNSGFRQFVDVEIADFDDYQIQSFINSWYSQEQGFKEDVAKHFWQLLSSPEYVATKELSHNPLLLTYLCLVFNYSFIFPKNRAELYRDTLDILLKRWTADKQIIRDTIYQDLTLTLEEIMLSKIAYEQFCKNRLFFDSTTVISEIRKCLSENLNAPKHLDGEAVLREIQVQQGILVERARGVLSFSHLTLQEYLTAKYMVDNNLIDELISRYLIVDQWEDVFLLVAGSIPGSADSLLEKMAISASYLINTKKLCALVIWANLITKKVDSQMSYLSRRHLALALAGAIAIANTKIITNTIPNDYIFNNILPKNSTSKAINAAIPYANTDIESYIDKHQRAYIHNNAINASIQLINSLSELKVFCHFNNADITRKIYQLEQLRGNIPIQIKDWPVHQEFMKEFLMNWCQTLKLKLDWLDLSDLEIRNLDKYFKVTRLIIECKGVAISVSPTGWSNVKEKIFRPIESNS
jgi:energy-coupling factor transporter ATP-binding protein EcfA2